MKSRYAVSFLAVMLSLLLFSGCAGSSSTGILRCDIPAAVENLDPQFATDPAAMMIIRNIYEGLVVRSPNGEIIPGAAESFDISADGLTYTFILRDGLKWPDKQSTPITADDFRYGLERLFYSSSPSPYAEHYTAIRGASELIDGTVSDDGLGIYAQDNLLTLSLNRPDPQLLARLAEPAAMPCNRAFFLECRGRYGLEKEYVLSNGPYQIKSWNNEKSITLRINESYLSQSPAIAEGMDIYIARGEPSTLFADGRADIAPVGAETAASLEKKGIIPLYYEKTIWCAVTSGSDPVWGSVLLRQALAVGTDRRLLGAVPVEAFTPFDGIIPPDLLLSGRPLSEYGYKSYIPAYNPAEGTRFISRGMEAHKEGSSTAATLIIPDSDSHALAISYIQQGWQRDLDIFPIIRRHPENTLTELLHSGDFEIMLVGISPPTGFLQDYFALFLSHNRFAGYANPLYDRLYQSAISAPTVEESARIFAQAQSQLLADGIVIPLYLERGAYAVAKEWQGLWIYPQEGVVYIKYARQTG